MSIFPNGAKKSTSIYSNEGQDVTIKSFSEDGKLVSETMLRNNKPQGNWTFWDSNGNLKLTENYEKGKLEGIRTEYKNGKKIKETNYEKGGKNGITTTYFSNKKKKSTINFLRGQLNGPYVVYDKNGKVNHRGSYLQNNKHGNWYYYDSSGDIIKQLSYKKGKLIEKENKLPEK